MISFTHVIQDAEGLHARPAALIAAAALPWESTMVVTCGDRRASAPNPVELMMLDAVRGDVLEVEVSGVDEEQAAAALREVFTF